MSKFIVEVTRTVTDYQYTTVEVEADSAGEAHFKVTSLIDNGETDDWGDRAKTEVGDSGPWLVDGINDA